MRHANNEKRELTHDGRNVITKSRKIILLGEQETYKYLGMFEADTIEQVEMKEKLQKSISRESELLETKLYCRNQIKGINILYLIS